MMDPRRRGPSLSSAAEAILLLDLPHPARVAVDGRTASGKTTFADALAAALQTSGRGIIRASIDDFHHPRAVRHRQGRHSPDGYYEDARDLVAVRRYLLEPLGPGGDRCFATRTFDLARDRPVQPDLLRAEERSILIVDGTFLQRPEIVGGWDFVIFLDVPQDEARQRGLARDADALGADIAATLYDQRYGPAFARYQAECRPSQNADMVIAQRER